MKDTESTSTSTSAGTEMGNIYISSEQIIQEVQKFRCLYDPADPDHKDRDVMRDAWLTVTQAVVGEPWAKLNNAEKYEAVKEFRRRWRNIKDTMRKWILQANSTAGSAGTRKRPYHHYNKLKFLLETDSFKKLLNDTSEPRTARSLGSSKKKGHTTEPYIHVMKKEAFTVESDSSVASPSEPCHQQDQDSTFESVHSSTPAQQNVGVPEHLNPDLMFMFSLLPRVSALRSREKLDFQIKVMKLLQGYETYDTSA